MIHERAPKEVLSSREKPLLTRYRGAVDQQLTGFLDRYPGLIPNGSSMSGQMAEYHFGFRDGEERKVEGAKAPGKVIRPTLLLLTADAMGADWEKAVPAAAGLELAHNSTLIHDDVIDHDLVRHNKPNVAAKYGEGQAVNAGDTALLMGMLAVNELQGYPDGTVRKAVNHLAHATLQVIEGQAVDVSFEDRRDVTVKEYLEMTDLKTGALFVGAARMGALLGGAEGTDRANHLEQYAGIMGRLFGRDDYLNIWGDASKTGKYGSYTDLIRRKQTFPVIHALEFSTPEDNARLLQIYDQDKPELDMNDVGQILDIFDRTRTKQAMEGLMDGLHERAVEEIKAADLGWAEKDYIDLADFFAHRDH